MQTVKIEMPSNRPSLPEGFSNLLDQQTLKEYVHYCRQSGQMTVVKTHSLQLINKVPFVVTSKDAKGYLKVMVRGVRYQVHRLAFLYVTGVLPVGLDLVDHRNGITDDNRWDNLRLLSNQENIRNQSKDKATKSGRTGVHVNETATKTTYKAHIRVDKVLKHLGTFNTLEEALAAREAAEKRYFTTTH